MAFAVGAFLSSALLSYAFHDVFAFTELHQAIKNEVGIYVCDYRGFKWLNGKVSFLDTCMMCECEGKRAFSCASIGGRYRQYPRDCIPLKTGCEETLVMKTDRTRECIFIEPVVMVGK